MLLGVIVIDPLHGQVTFAQSLGLVVLFVNWLQFSVTHGAIHCLEILDETFCLLLELVDLVEHGVEVLHVGSEFAQVAELVLHHAPAHSVLASVAIEARVVVEPAAASVVELALMVCNGTSPPVGCWLECLQYHWLFDILHSSSSPAREVLCVVCSSLVDLLALVLNLIQLLPQIGHEIH